MGILQGIENSYRRLNNITILRITADEWVTLCAAFLTVVIYNETRSLIAGALVLFLVSTTDILIRRRAEWRVRIPRLVLGTLLLYLFWFFIDYLPVGGK